MKLLFSVLFFLFVFSSFAYAESSYVLPYPSAMPGNIFYKINFVKENILRYWYFGDFGQFDFNLKQSDKYLVEAKILFDYKQYLLGYNALLKSDYYIKKVKDPLEKARNKGKNISEKEGILKAASEKHIEELKKIKQSVPEKFEWIPEKDEPTVLNLAEAINRSIRTREQLL